MLTNLSSESSNNFICEYCDYSTSRNSQYQRHIKTDKHKTKEKSTFCQQLSTNVNKFSSKFFCECGKIYKERTGLWRHKNKCCNNKKDIACLKEKANTITDKDELIMYLIKECTDYKNIVTEQQNMMMKVIENSVNNNNNNSHNNNCNNNNKTFNLQVFLNETCKDAMNITDFIESIKLQLSDLEKIADVGYVEGISNIISTNLKVMDVTQRPVHCTDKKRETMYIKDENQWTKEDEKNSKLRKVIKSVTNKNIRLLPQFREKYPDYNNSNSKISDKYDKMVIEVMTSNIDKEDKIIRNISNVTIIDKLIKET